MSPTNINIEELRGVTQDSRSVKSGYLFAALKGDNVNGNDYIEDAVKRGASVVLSDGNVSIASDVQVIKSENPRKEFSHIVAEFYDAQPENIIAVTGTNGKTSVVHFVNQLWSGLGLNSSIIGTLSGSMTTPDSVSMHETLAQMSVDGVTHVALEASSHGLEQYRMDGAQINVAAFTSFSQDHLDYHLDMQSYLAAKSRLFAEVLPLGGVAVLNADSVAYDELKSVCKRRGNRVLSYGEQGADVNLLSCEISGIAQDIEIYVLGKAYSLRVPLIGKFQVENALCALACVLAKYPEKAVLLVDALSKLEGAAGRLQHVASKDGELNTYVDYAHTPDALENVLEALRPHTSGKLICVFGCGGDRDKSKRALMGKAAAHWSDIAIVTDDNPRSENPDDIRKEVIGNNKNICEIADRREAIEFAIEKLSKNDILLVAGKGHEQGQIIAGVTKPFDDVKEIEKSLNKRKRIT